MKLETDSPGSAMAKVRRDRFRNPAGRVCDCSAPAVAYTASGFVCGRCLALEQKYYKAGQESLRQELRSEA
jgi:hypothetical protein